MSAGKRNRPPTAAVTAMVAVMATIGGCTVGPDFRRPDPPTTTTYTATPLPAETVAAPGTGGAAQRFAMHGEIPARWWELFQSPALDQLIRQALQRNPTLAAAQATLRQARENLAARRGTEYYPSVDASVTGARQKVSGAAFGEPNLGGLFYGLYNATVSVSYTLDLFGAGRRDLEALQSQADYQQYQLEAAHLTLTANIITAAVQEASLRAQLKATREIITLQERHLELVERQFQLGGASRSDVLAQQAQVAQTRTILPPLDKALAQVRNQLAVYSGSVPSEAALPVFELENLHLPQELPVSLPSTLVRQRPDILAAEELLHAASAQVGVATANLYPQITLTGSMGSQTARLQDLFSPGTSVWSLGAGITQPVFHGGELTAKRRAAVAAFDQAAALYRGTVLQAFQNVADVLQALDADARTLRAQTDAETAALDSLTVAQQQFRFGAVSYLSLLIAQRQYQQALVSLVQAQAARFADTAALFQALGGGWWNQEPEPVPANGTKNKPPHGERQP